MVFSLINKVLFFGLLFFTWSLRHEKVIKIEFLSNNNNNNKFWRMLQLLAKTIPLYFLTIVSNIKAKGNFCKMDSWWWCISIWNIKNDDCPWDTNV